MAKIDSRSDVITRLFMDDYRKGIGKHPDTGSEWKAS